MKIAIVAPGPVPAVVGGAEKLWWGMEAAFARTTSHEVELIKLDSPERNFAEVIDSYRQFSRLQLDQFDRVISTKYPAWMVRHEDHWVYLQHRLRGLYDTYPAALPPALADWPGALAPLRRLLAAEPDYRLRDELFDLLAHYRQSLAEEEWESLFAFPGPLARQLVHWLDDSALQPGLIRKFMAISRTVRERPDYFPAGVPVQVIHHPSDLEPAESTGQDYFFTVSRLDAPKRLDLLARAFSASGSDRRLLIAGSGPQQGELEALAAADPRIELLGRVDDAALRRYYGAALCVPYIPRQEDFGLITVEAMQVGKPLLTCSDSGGVLELVEDGVSGWVVEPTEAALAAAIDAIAAQPQRAAAMAPACRERVAHINWDDTLAAILDPVGCVQPPPAGGLRPRHILVPLTFPVYPPQSGGQNRVFHLYRAIARQVPVTLLTLCSAEEAGLDMELAPGLREIRIPKSPHHQLLEREAEDRLGGTSIADIFAIEHIRHTPVYMTELRALADSADLVVASHPYLYRAIRAVYRGRIYYEAHNVELDMKRDILGEDPLAASWLDQVEAVERDCAADSIGLCACSEMDRQRLQDLYQVPLEAIAVVPNGVARAEIPRVSAARRRRTARRLLGDGRAAALFMGSWHGPNIEAVGWIIAELAPALPQTSFWVVGSVCNFWQKQGNKPLPRNVMLLGQLDEADKNAVLSCAQVAINPVTSGSGSNLKMAEYAAAGLTVISTPFGCRGMALEGLGRVETAEIGEFADALNAVIDTLERDAAEKPGDRRPVAGGEGYDWQNIAGTFFSHLVSVYAGSVYNPPHR